MRNITLEIKKLGLDIGFDKVGISPAIQPPKSNNFKMWLDKGFAGKMKWMKSHQDKRMDIQQFFEVR